MIAITADRVAAPVEGMHRAIADRWLGMAGPRVEPVRRLVDGLTASIYGTVRFGGSAVGSTISIVSELASGHVSLRPVWETPRGRYVQSIFNGVFGDGLAADESPLRIDLGLRDLDGTPLATSPTSLGRAFPDPTRRLAVMLHGFGETERCWRSGNGSTLTEGLEADGFSVLLPRYNTGRAVTDNASDLADLLERVRLAWPVPVEEFTLIGHSMGGLVARSAVVAARSSGHEWVELATHLVGIGTPHLGSPIEKGVHAISTGLGLFKETRPLAAFLEGRSAGIKDLRHGVDNRPEGVQYHVVAGAVTTRPTHPLGVLVGDLVVRVGSALGRGRHRRVESSNVLVVGGRHHAGLLHDPGVISHTRGWLAEPRHLTQSPNVEVTT
jgi:pimeloyl-ACP methyl ester carboxylesterase